MRRLHMNGPSHQDIQDLATMTEQGMMATDVDAVMAQTGMTEENLEEFASDVIIDLVASLPEDMFYELQLNILSERLGDLMPMEFDDARRRADGPTIESILDDIKQIHESLPADRLRMNGQQQAGAAQGAQQPAFDSN